MAAVPRCREGQWYLCVAAKSIQLAWRRNLTRAFPGFWTAKWPHNPFTEQAHRHVAGKMPLKYTVYAIARNRAARLAVR